MSHRDGSAELSKADKHKPFVTGGGLKGEEVFKPISFHCRFIALQLMLSSNCFSNNPSYTSQVFYFPSSSAARWFSCRRAAPAG